MTVKSAVGLCVCVHQFEQPILEYESMCVLPFRTLQYQTEADKRGFCFICHIAAYEFERRADVSSDNVEYTHIEHTAILCYVSICFTHSCSNMTPICTV